MSSTTSRSLRSSISPFRSRKTPPQPPPPSVPPKYHHRPTTPSSTNSSTASFHNPNTASATSTPSKAKENVTVTVRFRPLSAREISKGDEVAWYADGDNTVRNEYNPDIAYSFDRVFGPATTTRHVYDIAAQHVVGGAMEGVNGTVFAYGVTSSGKTHTMHGEQKSPGIIPLAVKDVFGIIQETPGREFLLRVSYLEIYNEVINDLLDPTGQNLRIREDSQGTYVEGIKEEVVLSPAHALSLIASGEEHRHVGSNNFNLLSSRSHTIFTLTIESSPRGGNQGEEVALSQLHLIDLAGSESSKTETTGLRRKEDGKSTHIPYRDSKLTRLLQSSLSGHGRVSLICTVTPASSNTEETHNTLKFAHRSKHVEIKASQNKIIDEKSLIKKYQKEISNLKEELQQLKRGMMENQNVMAPQQEDLVNLKLQLEAGQVKLQSRLEEEEQAKAALMGRIQRLTKLILVSTKNTIQPTISQKPGHRRRHSFGEDELAYLPDKKREYMIDEDAGSIDSEISMDGRGDVTNLDELVKDYKSNRRRGMLGWFKVKKPDNLVASSPSADYESSANGSPASSSKSSQSRVMFSDMKDGQRKSISRRVDDASRVDSLRERTQAGDLFSAAVGGRRPPPTGTTITDQMDLLREQIKMLAGEVALCTSSLKRLSEQAAKNPEHPQLQENMRKMRDEIREKKLQMRALEQRMLGSVEISPHGSSNAEMSEALSRLATQLNEKTFELEIKSADNRVLQEQLQVKTLENAEMHETILLLRQQLDSLLLDKSSRSATQRIGNDWNTPPSCSEEFLIIKSGRRDEINSCEETSLEENTPTSVMSLNRIFNTEVAKDCNSDAFLNSQHLLQAAEIESLKQEIEKLAEEKDGLEIHSQRLADEATYAKELAAAAAVELRNLAEEVTKLSYQNAKLTAEVASKEFHCKENCCQRLASIDTKQVKINGGRFDARLRKPEDSLSMEELEQERNARYQREACLVNALSERDKIEVELRKKLDEAKKHEENLENELANMWILVASMRKSVTSIDEASFEGVNASNVLEKNIANGFSSSDCRLMKKFYENGGSESVEEPSSLEELEARYNLESRCKELENIVLRFKGDDVRGLNISTLEELQNFHVEAILPCKR
ncbi:P-loop containing nucleoside triphosphate hydrolase superfamily protein [Forsythia ovata]|uniref:P-loop containing nucleoside triphosphate hydrolase superfamily protein n=1 Tax=Forsythia ovata TaxID=205694 RepID=A0ABD1PV06_9LAMI